MKFVGVMFLLMMVSGCSIKQSVKPVTVIARGAEVCIVENLDVRESFLEAYKQELRDKSLVVKMLPFDADRAQCAWSSTYVARWRWDLALYMAFARINIYHQGRYAGGVFYDAQSGGGGLRKFISAEEKLRELVDQMFPHLLSEGEEPD